MNMLISGLSCSEGGGGRAGALVNFAPSELGSESVEMDGESTGVAMDACMASNGALIMDVGRGDDELRLVLLLKLVPDQCLLSVVEVCRGQVLTTVARQGKASVQDSMTATVVWQWVAMM